MKAEKKTTIYFSFILCAVFFSLGYITYDIVYYMRALCGGSG